MQGGIDPSILKFVVALLIATLAVELVSRISQGAAWVLVGVVVLGLLINNPILTGFLNLTSQSIQKGIS